MWDNLRRASNKSKRLGLRQTGGRSSRRVAAAIKVKHVIDIRRQMAVKSFVDVGPDSHFPLENLPYGVFKPPGGGEPRPGVAIGDFVLDLSAVSAAGLFDGLLLKNSDCFLQNWVIISHEEVYKALSVTLGGTEFCWFICGSEDGILDYWVPSLNKFLEMGRPAWTEARATLQKLLSVGEPTLRDNAVLREKSLLPMDRVQMLVPIAIGDYTDFFSSMHHAKNCGTIFRGPENAIPPNWFHLPIAYHGRASSVVISGTDIIRPRGQGHPVGNSPPKFGPSLKLDFELEMAAVIGPGNELGRPVDVNKAADHIFGLVLLNDWSGTTISPWIVTLDALEPFACAAPKQDPPPLPYLTEKISKNYDIPLEVQIKPAGQEGSVVTRSNFNNL
ncbi:hypothetical protein ACLOJK_035773 [Asimina triloba]